MRVGTCILGEKEVGHFSATGNQTKVPATKGWPQFAQNLEPEAEYLPQDGQREDAWMTGGPCCTMTCVGCGSLLTDQIKAPSQPMKVQPRNILSRRIATNCCFLRARIAGKKYSGMNTNKANIPLITRIKVTLSIVCTPKGNSAYGEGTLLSHISPLATISFNHHYRDLTGERSGIRV
jgi:hypothetical protein